jgi:D-psicose/D-tagatose/L-ribulose 3-epimerase
MSTFKAKRCALSLLNRPTRAPLATTDWSLPLEVNSDSWLLTLALPRAGRAGTQPYRYSIRVTRPEKLRNKRGWRLRLLLPKQISNSMNPIGIHFGYWTQSWNSEPIQFVKRARKCGFDVLEVNAAKITLMSNTERDALKGAAADAGLRLTYSIGLKDDKDVASEDAATRKNGVDFLKDVSRAMKYFGGSIMAGINYSSWPRKLLPGEDKEILTERAVGSVREAIKTAEDCDVIFCVEVVNRFEQFIMNTASEGIAFSKRVGSPNCKILLDTFHMNIEEDSLRGSIVESGSWLGHFHIGEPNRRPPGRGRMPWPEIFGALREINYNGAVVMEPFLVPGGEVGRDISVFRDLLGSDDLDEEAARSVEFVRSEQKKSGQ